MYRICAMTVIFMTAATLVAATPAKSIKLNYDDKLKTLHIEVEHYTNNPREHRVRRIEVFKNGEEVGVVNMTTQTTASTVVLDVPLEAAAGDKILVEVQCNKSGPRQETLTVPESSP